METFESAAGLPIIEPLVPETMQAYFARLREKLDASVYKVVERIDEDGLYIGKRAVRDAQGQADLLNHAGTVFYHTIVFIRAHGKTKALDYGPVGSADITANLMEPIACGPILNENAVPEAGTPLVRIQVMHHDLEDSLCTKAISFSQGRKYHAINNNCIQNTDFFCRILTRGRVRNAPMIYDLIAGKVPDEDHPMLLMFFLMTRLSWFHVCDGSKLTVEFLESQGILQPKAASATESDGKPTAQSRIEEQQLDLMKVMQALQPQANGAHQSAEPKPS